MYRNVCNRAAILPNCSPFFVSATSTSGAHSTTCLIVMSFELNEIRPRLSNNKAFSMKYVRVHRYSSSAASQTCLLKVVSNIETESPATLAAAALAALATSFLLQVKCCNCSSASVSVYNRFLLLYWYRSRI